MKNPNPLMLVRIAQGDAYGMACEYIKFPRDQETYDRALRFDRYGKHPTHRLEPGQYTDDTQMSVAVSEVLLEKDVRPSPFVKSDEIKVWFRKSFYNAFKRDQRDGYSRGFQELLEKATSPEHLATLIRPNSNKNGAAMRAVPIGVLDNPNHVKFVANLQAKVTHDTAGGTSSAIAVALMSHFALHTDKPLAKLPEWLRENMQAAPAHYLEEWPGGPVGPEGEVGVDTARAVMTVVSREKSMLDIARRVIEWGGDTDSVLSIAWGIASTRMHESLPPFFDGGLENKDYGYKFLYELGHKLMDKFA